MDRPHSRLKSIESILSITSKRLGIEKRMKELMIMQYWSELARGHLANDSKPHSIIRTNKGLTLCVATKTSMVAQELSMVKMHLLDKLNNLSSQIGFSVADISFSAKYWADVVDSNTGNSTNNEIKTDNQLNISVDYDEITLPEDQVAQIELVLANMDCEDSLKMRLKKIMTDDLKLKSFKKDAGYPKCSMCGVVLRRMEDKTCPSCSS